MVHFGIVLRLFVIFLRWKLIDFSQENIDSIPFFLHVYVKAISFVFSLVKTCMLQLWENRYGR